MKALLTLLDHSPELSLSVTGNALEEAGGGKGEGGKLFHLQELQGSILWDGQCRGSPLLGPGLSGALLAHALMQEGTSRSASGSDLETM